MPDPVSRTEPDTAALRELAESTLHRPVVVYRPESGTGTSDAFVMVELARGVLALSVALEAARQRLAQVEEELARLRETVTALTEALELADDLLARLEGWDAFNIPDQPPWGDWPSRWKGEVVAARAALEAARLREGPE